MEISASLDSSSLCRGLSRKAGAPAGPPARPALPRKELGRRYSRGSSARRAPVLRVSFCPSACLIRDHTFFMEPSHAPSSSVILPRPTTRPPTGRSIFRDRKGVPRTGYSTFLPPPPPRGVELDFAGQGLDFGCQGLAFGGQGWNLDGQGLGFDGQGLDFDGQGSDLGSHCPLTAKGWTLTAKGRT